MKRNLKTKKQANISIIMLSTLTDNPDPHTVEERQGNQVFQSALAL